MRNGLLLKNSIHIPESPATIVLGRVIAIILKTDIRRQSNYKSLYLQPLNVAWSIEGII